MIDKPIVCWKVKKCISTFEVLLYWWPSMTGRLREMELIIVQSFLFNFSPCFGRWDFFPTSVAEIFTHSFKRWRQRQGWIHSINFPVTFMIYSLGLFKFLLYKWMSSLQSCSVCINCCKVWVCQLSTKVMLCIITVTICGLLGNAVVLNISQNKWQSCNH